MAGIGYAVRTMVVTIDPDPAGSPVSYQCAVTGVTETPTADTVRSQTACADGSLTDVGPTTWELAIAYNVSNMPTSLHRLLSDHAGELATVSVEPFPVQEPGQKIEYDVVLSPAGADYTVGAFGTATVTLAVRARRNIDAP